MSLTGPHQEAERASTKLMTGLLLAAPTACRNSSVGGTILAAGRRACMSVRKRDSRVTACATDCCLHMRSTLTWWQAGLLSPTDSIRTSSLDIHMQTDVPPKGLVPAHTCVPSTGGRLECPALPLKLTSMLTYPCTPKGERLQSR